MVSSIPVTVGFLLALTLTSTAEAKLYKWVDDKGTTHYGEIVPPEYANKEKDSLSKAGLIQKKIEKETPETRAVKEEAEKKRKIDNQAVEEQKRRDNAILNTYSNESEIDSARDRSLVLLNARLESNVMLLKSAQANLDGHKKEAEKRSSAGKKIPVSLVNDIARTEEKISHYANERDKTDAQLAAVKTRFDNDKELFRKLKGF